ncbi:MAG: alpha/beta hydrolase [Leptospiraceae bacterium]|nr:alpha/beta hydrolase [Leptospiraceae bacterium]
MKIKIYTEGNKNNPPILFLHGFPFDHRMWKSQIDFLKKDYYCISYNILGNLEKSKKYIPTPFEFFVDDFFYVVEKIKLGKLIVCGLSMGGYIILRALERNMDIFSKIILCDTRTEADTNETKLKRVEGIKKIDSVGIKKFLKDFADNTMSDFTKKTNPELYKKALKITKDRTAISTKSALIAVQGRTDTTSVLRTISIPSLILCGEYDSITPISSMEYLCSQIPTGEFVKIPNAGHLAPFENPKTANEKILEFLNK